MKDLKLKNLSPEEYAELRRLVSSAEKATSSRYRAEEACQAAYARLAQKNAELSHSEKEEAAALARLNRFLATHRQKPQSQPQTNNRQVATQWANSCKVDAALDAERHRRESFTKLG